MDPLRAKAVSVGYFTRADALAQGHDDRSIKRMIGGGAWRRVRRGAYTCSDLWPTDPVAAHLVRARAALERIGTCVALSHVSAALLHGLDVWDADLDLVHVTRLDGGAGRTEAGVVHHEGFTLDSDLVSVDGMLATHVARAALETATMTGAEGALCVLDSSLHDARTDRARLESTFALMQSWPGIRASQVPVRLADGRSESVGESRLRYLCFAQDLPAPQLQHAVHDETGNLVGTSDFFWPGLLGEFDGKVKYGRYLRPGETPADAVFREKRREDRMCEQSGCRMVRFVWADLYVPDQTASRVRRLLRTAA